MIFDNGKWTTSSSKRTRTVSQGISSLGHQNSFINIISFSLTPIHAYSLLDGVENISNKSSSGLCRN